MTCPPCTGNCNQGDECPLRKQAQEQQQSADGEALQWLLGVIGVVLLIAAVAVFA